MSNVIPLRPIRWDNMRADEAQRVIRERARGPTANIKFTFHALEERGKERAITTQDALEILRMGFVSDPPLKNQHGEWEVKMEKRLTTGRDACAVTIVIRDDETLIIKTLMWKDPR